jgi:lysine/ornithine N-monooxygenase
MGEYFHVPLAWYCHVKWIRRNGAFVAGWHSDLVREYMRPHNSKYTVHVDEMRRWHGRRAARGRAAGSPARAS